MTATIDYYVRCVEGSEFAKIYADPRSPGVIARERGLLLLTVLYVKGIDPRALGRSKDGAAGAEEVYDDPWR